MKNSITIANRCKGQKLQRVFPHIFEVDGAMKLLYHSNMIIIETKIHSLVTIAFPGIDQPHSSISRMFLVFLTISVSHPNALDSSPASPILHHSHTQHLFALPQIEIHNL